MPKIQMIFCCLLFGGYVIPNSYSQKLFRNEEDIRILTSRSRPQWSQFLFLGPHNTQNPNSNGYFYQIDPYQQSHHKILTPNERIRVASLIHQVKNLRQYEQRNIKEIQEPLHGQQIQDFPQGRSLQSNYQQMPLKSQNNGYSNGATQEIETVNLETNGFKIPNKRILNSASIPVKAELNEKTYFPHQNFEHIKMNADSIHLPRDPIRENQKQKIKIHLIPFQIDAAPNGQISLSHKNFEHSKINAESAQLSRSAQRENQNERINIKTQKVYAVVSKKKNCNVASCLSDSAESAIENNTNRIKNISPIVSQKTNSSTQLDKSQGHIMNQSPLIRNLTLHLTPESIIKHQKSQQTFIHSNAKPSHIFGMNLEMQENHTKLEDTQSSGFVTTHKLKIKKLPSTNQRHESQRNWRKVAPNQRIQRTQNKQFIQDFIESTTKKSITSVKQIQHETTTEISKLNYPDEDAIFSDSFSTALFGQRLRPVKPLSQENKELNTQNLPSTDTNSSKSEIFQISLLNPNTVNNIKRKQYESSLAELNKNIFNLFWDSERLQIKNESRNSKFEEALLQENIPEISNIKSTTHGIDNDSLKLISYSDYMLDDTTGEESYTTENIPKRKLKPNSFATIRKIGMNAEHKSGKPNPKQPDQSFSSHQNTPKRKTNPLNSPQLKPQNISYYKSTSIPAHHRFANPYIFQTEDFYKQERLGNDMKNTKNMNNNKQELNADSQSFRSQPAEIERENNPLDAPQLQQDNTESYELTATTKFREPKEPNISQTDYIKSLKNAVLKLKVQVLPITENETLEKNDAEIKPHSVHHLHVFTNVYSKLPPNQIQSYFGPVKQYYIPPSHYHYPKFSYSSDPLSNAQTQFSLITPSFQEWQQLERNKTLKSTIRDQKQTIDDSDPPLSAKSYRNADFTMPTEATTPQSLESKTVKSASNKLEKIRKKEETGTSTTVVSAGSLHQVLPFGLTGNFKPVIISKASELPREVNGKQKNFENDNHRKMQFSPAPEVATNSEIKCDTYSFSGSSVTCHSYLESEDPKLDTTNTESKNKDRLIVTESLAVSNQYARYKNLNATRKSPYLTNSDNQKSDLQIEIPATVKQQNNFYKNNTTDKNTHIIWLKHRESKNESSLARRIPTPSKKYNDLYRNLNESRGISNFRSIKLANNSLKSITNLARNNDTFNLYNIKTPNPDESLLRPLIKNASVNTKITEKANIHSAATNNSQDSVIQPLLKNFQTGNKFDSLTITEVKKNNEKLIDHQKQEFQLVKQDHPTLLKPSQMANLNPNISGELRKLTENSDDILSVLEEEEFKYPVNKTKENCKVIAPLEIDENNATTVDPYTFITVTTDNYNEIRETTTIKYQTILENKIYISVTNETDFMKSRKENTKSEDVTSTNISESTLMENSNVLQEYVSATAILEDVTTEKPTNVEFSSKQSKEMESIAENIPSTEETSIGMMKIEKQKSETKPSVLFDKDFSPNNTEVNVKINEEFHQNTTQSINISSESENDLLLQQLLNISIHSQEKNLSSEEILQTNEGLKINQMNKSKATNEQNFTRNEHIILTEGATQKIRTSNFTERNDKNATFSDITHNKTAQSLNESSSQNNTDLNGSMITKQMESDVITPVNRISNFNTQQNNQNLNLITVTHEPSTELNTIENGTTLSIVVTENQMSSHD